MQHLWLSRTAEVLREQMLRRAEQLVAQGTSHPSTTMQLRTGDNLLRQPDAEKVLPAASPSQEEPELSPEEKARLEVLAELDRCQMPAVKKEDGALQKTIEHYTFADSLDIATISIEPDKDLYEGASEFLNDKHIEVVTKDNEVVVILHDIPATKAVTTPADWTLRLAPLFHGVESGETSWKLRKGKVSVKLRKKKPQEWKRVVKL
eukprot:TRINITY_DN8075_c0_g1_i1.p1 TRINITY_DN8075_c0_g1~~TRINITY_DN8075_c0_g1_i1.p1  ORF type:complete len:206 (-),score=57.12 TRINITY_DN8075_c0_g1_i1:49-666(-)